MINTIHAAGNILSKKVLASSHFPLASVFLFCFVFVNFTLQDQCAQDTCISLCLSLWLISKARRAPSFPKGQWKGEEVHKVIYLSLSVVLRTPAPEGACPASVIAVLWGRAPPFIKSTLSAPWKQPLGPLSALQCSTAPGQGLGPLLPSSFLSELSREPAERQILLLWKGSWLVVLVPCERASFVI